MDPTLVLLPSFAMVAVTLLVWITLYVQRLGEMSHERIDPEQIASSAQAAARLRDTRAADNFRNLFELPLLFHVAVVIAFVTGHVDVVLLGLAWAFVALRAVHSAIHCSYNRVMHRFVAYALATLVLWAFWALLALRIGEVV